MPVSALSVFSLGLHLVIVLLMCGASDMDVLYVTQNTFVSRVWDIMLSFNVTVSLC